VVKVNNVIILYCRPLSKKYLEYGSYFIPGTCKDFTAVTAVTDSQQSALSSESALSTHQQLQFSTWGFGVVSRNQKPKRPKAGKTGFCKSRKGLSGFFPSHFCLFWSFVAWIIMKVTAHIRLQRDLPGSPGISRISRISWISRSPGSPLRDLHNGAVSALPVVKTSASLVPAGGHC
jgi:hypothetical protein